MGSARSSYRRRAAERPAGTDAHRPHRADRPALPERTVAGRGNAAQVHLRSIHGGDYGVAAEWHDGPRAVEGRHGCRVSPAAVAFPPLQGEAAEGSGDL